ncbi:hypothetical protein P153DRAFT_307257 [Dothidotthia symphoricarpi CBS 119687]|uniref:ATP-grasp domain-containing protein n=1 Tax=Dothidotthia symphoricarpi CBS 119687 TaxID=1392245 RepID=A0A6A6AQM0_9PLEO|nr:uncharacterized protein P153DRAFT_307257 [Dothidotthia symphoricarpi CBS 119687]KAF2134239.1 hypothetical protein P153DRAFT_307257 [Dothidotthia symphoricarpi CBS 119687]
MRESKGGRVPFFYSHLVKNVFLLVLSFIGIPVSATIVLLSLAVTKLRAGRDVPSKRTQIQIQAQKDAASQRKTILVTGVSMTKGLAIARVLSQHTSHRIIGADISSLSPGRFSSAIAKYYRLEAPHGDDAEPYIDSILSIIRSEKVDLWISCSSVLAAVEDGQVVRLAEAQALSHGRRFEAIQFDEHVVEKFHEKDKFIDYIASLNLPIPESYRCTSAEQALNILLRDFDGKDGTTLGKKYIMKPIGVDDHARNNMMTLLPFPTADKTSTYIRNLNISRTNPFQLQQFIQGKEYCTHALVIRGQVKAFTSCPSSELLMHYEPLPAYSSLSQEMLKFTERVVSHGGETFTGHLSFDFLVSEEADGELSFYPIECNPRAHTAVVLFAQTPEMADAYLSIFGKSTLESVPVFPRAPTYSYYWIGHDLIEFVLLPILEFLFAKGAWDSVVRGIKTFLYHVVYWRDGTFALEDPLPFFVLYHLYWPARFVESLRLGKGWSRINVSTTKMFSD